MTNQFPHCFEFNEYFLTFVLDHLYSCLFGTFLGNSEKERRQSGIKARTQSLWGFVNHRKDMFLNPAYNARDSDGVAIFPESSVRYLKLWTGYYCRWNPRMRPQEAVRHRQTQLLAIRDNLRQRMGALKKELEGRKARGGGGGGHNTKDDTGVAGPASASSGVTLGGGVPTSGHPAAVMTKYESINI